ncbi:hypothetical protein [Tsukamurella sp. USMM236]|uniref:hypothetical protein n=1 Tax=Tsukamurella sp. USMM236 TaxID=3081301 RepID=UPI0030198313
MLQDDLRLSERLADHTLDPDYRDELWERKQHLGAALDRSRTRSWLVWHQHKKGVA